VEGTISVFWEPTQRLGSSDRIVSAGFNYTGVMVVKNPSRYKRYISTVDIGSCDMITL